MVYVFGELRLDERLYQLGYADETVPVEPHVFKLLVYLITQRDRVVTRNELFDNLWPGQVVGDAALTYCVAKARKAVRDTGMQQRVIKTIHGHGYRFIAHVSVQEESVDASAVLLRVVSEPPQEHILPAPQTVALPVPASPERDRAVWPLLQISPQGRQLTLVGCLFVFGWMTSLWQVSLQSPWKPPSVQTAVYHFRPEVTQTEGKLCHWWALSTQNQSALDALLQGWMYADRSTPEAKIHARWLFQRAIELDPTYAAAYASLGWMAWRDWLSWSQEPQSLDQASLYIQKAVALDSSCPHALTLLGDIMLTQRRRTQAVAEVERAIDLDLTAEP
jgi:DNA-binding winged helix-turn-helix (wHTH) protein